ncbi:DUF3152 domain-containing protein [Streptomyces sp. NPDC006283]|uniref:DUF3152 domain-containing protein n=1 Tax=Streptomyces sp. NPDC006283 TaxID=3156741 RepID=UPI00339EC05A
MGRHSRKGPAPKGVAAGAGSAPAAGERDAVAASSGTGRRRRTAGPGAAPEPSGYGMPQTRGGHPEHHEAGGGWGDWRGGPPEQSAQGGQRLRTQPPHPTAGGTRVPGPRREYLEAFDRDQSGREPYAAVTDWDTGHGRPPEIAADTEADALADDEEQSGGEPSARTSKGRTFTGIAAAAVTTVLAVVVAGQVTADDPGAIGAQSTGEERQAQERPDRSEGRATPPQAGRAAAPTYQQLMARQFPIDPKLEASGEFEAVPGFEKAPGEGRKIRYRVDVEKGLGLDGGLFAKAIHETLNDDRSWAHDGEMTFERISSGEAKFVITLASPGTTAVWCAKSGLDTTVDNVSCDSASTERVMINAFRWAQGAETYGDDAMLPYRQMLINHEVGHRLGHNHVNCSTPGALAPVMQQQTKTLEAGGVKCRANPWVHPGE